MCPPLVPSARYIHDYLDWSRWNETERGRKRRAARRERTKRTVTRLRPVPGRHSPDNDNIRLLFSQKHSVTNSRPLEVNVKGVRDRKRLNVHLKFYNMSKPERQAINRHINQSFSTHTEISLVQILLHKKHHIYCWLAVDLMQNFTYLMLKTSCLVRTQC